MSHVDPENLALLALGEPGAHPRDDLHLSGCPACQEELRQLSGVVSLARQTDGSQWLVDPPAGLWSRIAAETGQELSPGTQAAPTPATPAPAGPALAGPAVAESAVAESAVAGPAVAGITDTSSVPAAAAPLALVTTPPPAGPPAQPLPHQHQHWWQRPVAAAVAALIIGAGAALGVQHFRSKPTSAPAPVPTVIGRISLRPLARFPQWQGTSGIAVMERTTSGRLLKVRLQAPAHHGFYEVWLLARDGVKMISLGDLNHSHEGLFAMPPGVDLHLYTRVDISLQPFNGNPVHSASSVVRGTLP